MKRFYTTSTPDNGTLPTFETREEAIEAAKDQLATTGKKRFVVEIVTVVERDSPPVKVTHLDE